MRNVVTVLVGLLVASVACQLETPQPFPSKRPSDFSVEARMTGGAIGMNSLFVLVDDRLTASGRSDHEVQLSQAELDEVYQEVVAISRVRNRPAHRNDVADDFYGSMMATGGGARYGVTHDREASDVLRLHAMLFRMDQARAVGAVDLPQARPDDFSLSILISNVRGTSRGQWNARIDPRRSYVIDSDRSETVIHPTSEDLDRLYATCRAIAASSAKMSAADHHDESYYVTILGGRHERIFTGDVESLPPDIRALFAGLRLALDAMVLRSGR
jgi:hypothetical protein